MFAKLPQMFANTKRSLHPMFNLTDAFRCVNPMDVQTPMGSTLWPDIVN
jgi:hypothetical protein